MYLKNEQDCSIVNAWYECWKRYNASNDFLLIDSNSDDKWIENIHSSAKRRKLQNEDIFSFKITEKENIISFADNMGHLLSTGRDGWGRAFCAGIASAIFNDYDYAVHIESDLLFRGSVAAVVSEMTEKSMAVVGTKSWLYGWFETGLVFMDVQFLRNNDFLMKYNWKLHTRNDYPELIIPQIFGKENIFLKYWIGDRNDYGQIKDEDIGKCVYLTHCDEKQISLFMQ